MSKARSICAIFFLKKNKFKKITKIIKKYLTNGEKCGKIEIPRMGFIFLCNFLIHRFSPCAAFLLWVRRAAAVYIEGGNKPV